MEIDAGESEIVKRNSLIAQHHDPVALSHVAAGRSPGSQVLTRRLPVDVFPVALWRARTRLPLRGQQRNGF